MKLNKHYFVQIVNQNKGTIISLCKVYYSTCEDQQDAFQDIVLQLWNSFESFRGDAKINTWIYRVSLNTILNKKRRDARSISTESLDFAVQHIHAAKADDHRELLNLVLKTLKDIDKAIVVLYLEGYKNQEIAQILGLSSTNISTRFNRLKAYLKVKFNSKSHAAKRP